MPEDYAGKVFATLDGFITSDGQRNPASLVYFKERGLEVDGYGVRTVSEIIPPQIPEHFHRWLYDAGRVHAYDKKAEFGEGWKEIGRFDLRHLDGMTNDVAQKLEERFKTRILYERIP